jgi:hypothetical protein
MSETRHQFCRRHSSWFCPCVGSWLYGAAAKAAYENNEPATPRREIFAAENDVDDEEQLDLLERALR